MSLALGKNSVNVNQPLHLDNTNHLLVNDSTNKAVLDQIATNTSNISVNVDSLEVNTDGLEALQQTTINHLDGVIGHINNTNAIGSGQNVVKSMSLGYDRTNDKGVAMLVDSAGHVQTDIVSSALPSGAATEVTLSAAEVHLGNVDTKLGTIETDIELTNTKLDSIISNTAAIVIDGDAIQVNTDGLETLVGSTNTKLGTIETDIETTNTLLTQLDVVADNSLVKLTEIDTVLDASLVKQTNIETLLTAGNVDHAANEVLLTALVNDLAGIEIINAASEAHLGNIDTGIDVIEACVGSNKVNVNISSGNITGFATSALQGDIETSLDALIAANHTDLVALETSLTSMESKQDTMIGHNDGVETLLTAIDGRVDELEGLQGTANTHLSEIEGAVETLEACVGSSKVNVNISSGNISGFATQTTLAAAEVHLGNIETSVQLIDDIALAEDAAHSSGQKGVMFLGVRQSSQADFAADGDYTPLSIDDDGKLRVTSSAASGGSTEAKQDTIIGHLDGVEGKLDHLSDNLDTLETTNNACQVLLGTIDADTNAMKIDLAAIEVLITQTNSNQGTLDTTTQGVADAVEIMDAVLDNCLIKQTNIETLITSTNSKIDVFDAVLDAIKVDTEAIETAVETLATRQTKVVTQLLYGTSNLVANGTPESSSNSVEMTNNGERVSIFIEGQNSNWDAFAEWSYDNSTWFSDQGLNIGSQNILDHNLKKGKYLRVKINNNHGTNGDTNAFVVNVVQ